MLIAALGVLPNKMPLFVTCDTSASYPIYHFCYVYYIHVAFMHLVSGNTVFFLALYLYMDRRMIKIEKKVKAFTKSALDFKCHTFF